MELTKCDRCGSTAEKMGKLSIKTGEGILDGVMPKYSADICDKCVQEIREQFKRDKT